MMRMALEHLRGSLVRFSANDREGSHLVADILDAACIDPLGLAERPAHFEDRGLMLLDPRLPGGHPLFLLCAALGFRERIPGRPFLAVLAAKEDREEGIVCRHWISFPVGGFYRLPARCSSE